MESRVVTGAGTGIDRATARFFAAQGDHVLAVGRRREPLAETAAGHQRIRPFAADNHRRSGARGDRAAAAGAWGRVDVLVNNAGLAGSGGLGSYTARSAEPVLAANLLAPLLLTQAALPVLPRGAVVVNLSTSAGQRA